MIGGALLLLAPAVLAGRTGQQSSAVNDGVESAYIGRLFDGFLVVLAIVYALVLAYLLVAIVRGRRHRASAAGIQGEPPAGSEPRWHLALTLFSGATMLILFGLAIATWLTDRAIARSGAGDALQIDVIGHQWWWEVRYHDLVAGNEVRTANELVIPAGRNVHVTLSSQDVIHSLWIPNLAGKQDMIPGRSSDLVLNAAHPGQFRAQCAEFCGLQHARMALPVTALSGADFTRWYRAALQTPPTPTGGLAFAGYSLFQGRQCASCHNVAGTAASGQVAPDLSHIASRTTIAAGTLRNTPANLDRWIADPQAVKPGNYMPQVPLSSAERAAVVAYLETLK